MGSQSAIPTGSQPDDVKRSLFAPPDTGLSDEMHHVDAGGSSTSDRRSNPFTPGTPVDSPLMFFGRVAELSALSERVAGGVHSAVVGPPEIGVSSLLRQLAARLKAAGYLVAYVDLTTSTVHNQSGLSQSLWSQWWEQIRSGYVPAIGGMRVLEPLVRQLAGAGHKLVAMLDGYEQILWRPAQFDNGFQARLETLVQQGVLTLITGSQSPLAELHQQAASQSGLYTHLVQQDLGLLTPQEATQLLMTPIGRARFNMPAADGQHFVILAGTHPLFLHMIGAHAFAALESNRYDRSRVELQFSAAAEPYWQELWLSLPPPAKTQLAAKASTFNTATDNRLARNLRRKGLLRGEGTEIELFSQGFADWVARLQKASQAAGSVSGES